MGTDIRKRGETIRTFLLTAIAEATELMPASSLRKIGADKFGITERAIDSHIKNLSDQGSIELRKVGRQRFCLLKDLHTKKMTFDLSKLENQDEMKVYIDYVYPLLSNVGKNAEHILEHCFTEMFNNVIDHAKATTANVIVTQTAISTTILLVDDGIGIFKKIKNALKLTDERQSLLELSKGKFTTDPDNHSGEGIFFSSRACDRFAIFSNGLIFTHSSDSELDKLTRYQEFSELEGTLVEMTINNNTSMKLRKIFDQFSSVENGFNKTEVPVKLLQYKNEGLTSRSQAKRLLARIENFQYVTFDFENIESIGQAFADQIFRVFTNAHPDVKISVKNANSDIRDVIKMAQRNTVL